jgi:hypothetical protein
LRHPTVWSAEKSLLTAHACAAREDSLTLTEDAEEDLAELTRILWV